MRGEATEDRFLDGQVVVRQLPHGFRAGLDAVMLAAAVPAVAEEAVLELGAGAGTASLCLARRVGGIAVTGIEIESELVALASENASANRLAERVKFIAGDALRPPSALRHPFHHVLCNPPFHGGEGERSPDPARATALHDDGHLSEWITAGLKRTASGGTFTMILRADRLGEALMTLPPRGVRVFPLWPRASEAAKRVVVQARLGSRAPMVMAPGLVLHEADGRYTAAADAVLRGGPLPL